MRDDAVEILMGLAPSLAPGCADLSKDEMAEMRRIIAEAIETRTPAVRRRLRLFLWLLTWLPVLRYGRPLPRLSRERTRDFLARLRRSPILPFRAGILGVRTLVFMGYYGRAGAGPEFHYHPVLEGNRELPGA